MKIHFLSTIKLFVPLITLVSLLVVPILLPSRTFYKTGNIVYASGVCKGDYNNNKIVDVQDFGTFGQNYKKNSINCALDMIGDNCYLDPGDFSEFAKVYKKTDYCVSKPPTGTDNGIWISKTEIRNQPTSGSNWQAVYSVAAGSLGTPNVADQDSNHDVATMAAAIVCVRTGEFCDKARSAVVSAIGTEGNTRWLAVGRNMLAYTISADLLDLRADSNPSSNGSRVQTWLASFLTRLLPHNNTGEPIRLVPFDSGSNASAQEASVYAAISAYLNDTAKLEYVWNRFRLYSCDKVNNPETTIDVSNGVSYGWAHDNNNPCAVNPKGTTKVTDGISRRIDGAIINDMRRGGSFAWPPVYTSYPWVGLEGYVPTALILYRRGYPAFEIADKAVARTFEYLWYLRQGTGNVDWFDGSRSDESTQIINKYYSTSYPVQSGIGLGRTFGYTGFTHPTFESLRK